MEIPENIKSKLLHYQLKHVKHFVHLIKNKKRLAVIDGSDTGTGKTYTTPAVAKILNLKLLIICPKQVIPNWYRVAEDEFGVSILGVVNYETIKNGKYYESLNDFQDEIRVDCPYIQIYRKHKKDRNNTLQYTVNGRPKMAIEKITWQIPQNTLIVYDESHKGKNGLNSGNTVNSKLMISIRPYLSYENSIFCLMLSATITDKIENFDMGGYVLGLYQPHVKRVYEQFLMRLKEKGPDLIKTLHTIIYPNYGSRMSIDKIKLDPQTNTIFKDNLIKAKAYVIDAESSAKIEHYNKKIQFYMKLIREKGMPEGMGYIIRCWQKIEILKAPIVIQQIKKHYFKNRSVVVFTSFKDTKKLILDGLTHNSNLDSSRLDPDESNPDSSGLKLIPISTIEFIDGDQSGEERDDIVRRFQNDEINILICQIKAGGVALSLHDLTSRQRVSLILPTWSAIDFKQALGRIYRANSKSNAIQRIIYVRPPNSQLPGKANNMSDESSTIIPENIYETAIYEENQTTIEEKLCINVNVKLKNIDMLNNGTLGDDIFTSLD